MTGSPSPSITLLATAKNEGRFLLEWLAYYRTIGVTDILIYTNDCEDESPALLDRLAELGVLTHVPNPVEPNESPHRKMTWRARRHPLVTGADYVLPFDLDEFLVVKTGAHRVQDLIATAPEADMICLQMRFFGDNGLATLPRGLITETLTGASKETYGKNRMVKSLVKNRPMFSNVATPHSPVFKATNLPRVFNSGGTEVPPFLWPQAHLPHSLSLPEHDVRPAEPLRGQDVRLLPRQNLPRQGEQAAETTGLGLLDRTQPQRRAGHGDPLSPPRREGVAGGMVERSRSGGVQPALLRRL